MNIKTAKTIYLEITKYDRHYQAPFEDFAKEYSGFVSKYPGYILVGETKFKCTLKPWKAFEIEYINKKKEVARGKKTTNSRPVPETSGHDNKKRSRTISDDNK